MTREQIEDFLRAEDIEGFIELGAPQNEYVHESRMIFDSLASLPSEEINQDSIVTIICAHWMRSFNLSAEDMALRMPAIMRVAQQMI